MNVRIKIQDPTRPVCLRSRERASERGFTLIEVLFSMGILSILIAVATSYFLFNLRNNMNTQIRYEAIQAAQTVLDELRFVDVTTLTTDKNEDIIIGDRTYSVAVKYCQKPEFCLSDEIRHIAVGVTYKTQHVYDTDTVYSKF